MTNPKFSFSLSDLGNSNLNQQRRKIAALLEEGADINETDKNGVTPLHHAVRFRSPAAVQALLEHGARVNQACKRSGSTPLHRAVTSTGAPGTAGKQEEAIQIIDILLRFGANPALKNKNGKKPAAYVRDVDILARLKKSGPKGGKG
jgi:ankyrin repeat protein